MNPRPSKGDEESLEESGDGSLGKEFLVFLRDNKLWWLTPMVIMVTLLAVAAFFSPSPVAPFIYSLF